MPECISCPAPAAVTDDAGLAYCAACALSLADVLWAELDEAFREAVRGAQVERVRGLLVEGSKT